MSTSMFDSAITLTFAKAAKGSGGDKYKAELDHLADTSKARFIYVPQQVSRKSQSGPSPTLNMRFHTNDHNGLKFTLSKQAKGSGDNRYTTDDPNWGDMYLPKGLPEEIHIEVE